MGSRNSLFRNRGLAEIDEKATSLFGRRKGSFKKSKSPPDLRGNLSSSGVGASDEGGGGRAARMERLPMASAEKKRSLVWKPMEEWTPAEVGTMVRDLGSSTIWKRYAEIVVENRISGKILTGIKTSDMESYGFSPSHAEIVIDYVQNKIQSKGDKPHLSKAEKKALRSLQSMTNLAHTASMAVSQSEVALSRRGRIAKRAIYRRFSRLRDILNEAEQWATMEIDDLVQKISRDINDETQNTYDLKQQCAQAHSECERLYLGPDVDKQREQKILQTLQFARDSKAQKQKIRQCMARTMDNFRVSFHPLLYEIEKAITMNEPLVTVARLGCAIEDITWDDKCAPNAIMLSGDRKTATTTTASFECSSVRASGGYENDVHLWYLECTCPKLHNGSFYWICAGVVTEDFDLKMAPVMQASKTFGHRLDGNTETVFYSQGKIAGKDFKVTNPHIELRFILNCTEGTLDIQSLDSKGDFVRINVPKKTRLYPWANLLEKGCSVTFTSGPRKISGATSLQNLSRSFFGQRSTSISSCDLPQDACVKTLSWSTTRSGKGIEFPEGGDVAVSKGVASSVIAIDGWSEGKRTWEVALESKQLKRGSFWWACVGVSLDGARCDGIGCHHIEGKTFGHRLDGDQDQCFSLGQHSGVSFRVSSNIARLMLTLDHIEGTLTVADVLQPEQSISINIPKSKRLYPWASLAGKGTTIRFVGEVEKHTDDRLSESCDSVERRSTAFARRSPKLCHSDTNITPIAEED